MLKTIGLYLFAICGYGIDPVFNMAFWGLEKLAEILPNHTFYNKFRFF
ncbi:hypothetical protein [Ammoniphilus sp. 3BR4]